MTVIVIGIGTNSRMTVEDALAIIGRAKEKLSLLTNSADDPSALSTLAALDRPALNAILADAARQASLEAKFFPLNQLMETAPLCVTHSEKSMETYGIPSVAEAAALAAAGRGARLLIPRFRGRNTTASVAA